MKLAALTLLVACNYDATQDAIWTGTVKRDGAAPIEFVGYDPFPAQGFQFGGGIEAMGYLDAGGKLLAGITLHFTDRHDFEDAKSQAFPITLTITEVANDPGMGIDYIEEPASTSSAGQIPQTFHHEFDQHQTGTASGTFTVTACDYTTFMDGHLQATVMDPNQGTATRILDLQVHYTGAK